jgi:D,D-heptose 1,7-bisphosphate phosphatase
MGDLFPELPKPMIPVAGKPILQWQIEALVAQGMRDITLLVGYKADAIRVFFGNGKAFGARIEYIAEEEPLGTGGALSLLPREDMLILFGDLYCDVDFLRFIRFHREKQADMTLFVHPNSHPRDSDIVVTDGDDKVVAWKSKRDKERGELRNLVNAGLYVFSGDSLPGGGAIKRDLEHDVIAPMISRGGVYAYREAEYVKDVGTPERLVAAERDIEKGVASARSAKSKRRAVFLDRDGTINEESGFITSPEQIRLLPGAAEAIRRLNDSPYLAICVTNQPVIARGAATLADLEAIHARLDTLLGDEGAYLDDLLFCPHHPDGGFAGEIAAYKIDCDCRKPKPGMLLRAAERHNIDLTRSYMIGDRTADIAAGAAAGCVTIGLATGAGLKDGKCAVRADLLCDDLRTAVRRILEREDICDF